MAKTYCEACGWAWKRRHCEPGKCHHVECDEQWHDDEY